MIYSILFILFLLGLIFGSFSTVLIERWHSGKSGIIGWRSECGKCGHILWVWDLFPLFSYIYSRWNCRYCHSPIGWFYPITELMMGCIFAVLGYSAIQLGIPILSIEMLVLLFFGLVTGIYILYDIRYMEIPDQILVPAICLLLSIPILSILFIWYDEYTFHTFHISIYDRLSGAWILYTFFYIQILLPGSYYLIWERRWRECIWLIWSYISFPFVLLFDFLGIYKDRSEWVEIPTWVGGWDLRIAIFVGLTLGTLHGIASFIFAYMIGSIFGIAMLLWNRYSGKKTESRIAFGPFLGIGWILSILFYWQITLYHTYMYIGQ